MRAHEEVSVEAWQVVLAVFFALLPAVLMLDFWGDERLDFRGRPLPRDWQRQITHRPDPGDDHH